MYIYLQVKKDQYWLSKEKNVKRHNFKHIIHVFFNCNFFFCIFLDHCSFRTPGYGNTPGIPRAYSKLPSLRTGRVSNFAAIFSFLYIFNRPENEFVVLYSKLIRKAFILKPKTITHLMHDKLKPILIFGFEKNIASVDKLKTTDSFQGWRFQKSFF